MSEQISGQSLTLLLARVYGVKVRGEPTRLPGEGGQHVFKVELASGEVWTVRLGLASRPREKLLSEVKMLRFLNGKNFPAPRLKTTLAGEALFEWQAGLWGYALEFVAGNHPDKPETGGQPGPLLDEETLAELGHLLGKLHNLPFSESDDLPAASWLDEVPRSIEKAEQMLENPVWRRQAEEVVATLKALPLAELKRLPRVPVHTDAHEGNLIWTPEKRLYLLDWENAGLDTAVIDLALVLSWLCSWQPVTKVEGREAESYAFNEEYCITFLTHYQQERILSTKEREMLGPAIQFLDGWFAARDMEREVAEPGSTSGMAVLNLALMRSVTPENAVALTHWAGETAPNSI